MPSALPAIPPTSEQVFTTVHTEFGHCANEEFRTTSQHVPGMPVPAHVDQDPPYYILLSTYISYLILICLGHLRDFVGKQLRPSSYKHLVPQNVSPLFLIFFWFPYALNLPVINYRVMHPLTLISTHFIPAGLKPA